MAHIGRAYERLFRRDMSLKPGGYCYLPKRWEWTGIQGIGAYIGYYTSPMILDPINDDGFGASEYRLKWRWKHPTQTTIWATFWYTLTRTESMASLSWLLSINEVVVLTSFPAVNVSASFPLGQLPSTSTGSGSGNLQLTNTGNFHPKTW